MQLAERLRLRRLPDPQRARAIRIAAGATQPEVADALGVHVVTVARWEAGSRKPRGLAAERYAALLRQLQEQLIGT